MRRTQAIATLLALLLLAAWSIAPRAAREWGGLSWSEWIFAMGLALAVAGGLVLIEAQRRRSRVDSLLTTRDVEARESAEKAALPISDPDGPTYPHPVINVETCIGCHACVDACPHDVLAIVNGKAVPIAIEQCVEDTSCQVECPTVPKSCIVVNTTKKIPERKVPQRDRRLMTNVPGVYLIGDVSGVPLIKNAINEGGEVIEQILTDLEGEGVGMATEFDLAIIGVGPAGLSATARAAERGLKYVAIEQDQIASTIQQTYQAGKYVYFNPVDRPVSGAIPIRGSGMTKEEMLAGWIEKARALSLNIREGESCRGIMPAAKHFVVKTDGGPSRQAAEYRARRVVIAIGNRGTPMRLRVKGEDLKLPVKETSDRVCRRCGAARREGQNYCDSCGKKFESISGEEEKVKYRLTDPDHYRGRRIVVVGAGNSAIEAAIDLAAVRSSDGKRLDHWRDNEVSLVIRSDFKGDLKLGNKMMVYDCIDEGRIRAYFGMTIKEITPGEVILMSARERDAQQARETARIPNDYVFALIGGEKPTKFLEDLGISIR